MKRLIILMFMIPLVGSYGQEIYLSRDTLRIDDFNSRDSIIVFNRGVTALNIDSVRCKNPNYALNIDPNGNYAEWRWIGELPSSGNPIIINSNDSLKVRLDIAWRLTKISFMNYDQIDTMYFYNNSINSPVQPIEITNKVTIGGVENENIPNLHKLSQNYPNPFNPSTSITFELPERELVSIRVYNLLGEEVADLVNEELSAGTHQVRFSVVNLPSGIYFYQMKAKNFIETKKCILMK
ncbi:T9SS type A sorting domain-containing protein [Bacteroidota bacterium]